MAAMEHPHMCTISLAYDGYSVFAGGASLISPNMALSLASGVGKYRGPGAGASQCLRDTVPRASLSLVCGDVNLHEAGPGRQTRNVSNILIHPEFDQQTLINDFAVLLVDQPFELNEYIGTICLPDPGDSQEVK